MYEITELLNLRERFGGDKSAINRHSIRVYMCGDSTYVLDRTTDCNPRFFILYERTKDVFCRDIKIFDKRAWGDGLTWKNAEIIAFDAIRKIQKEKYEQIA